MWNCCQDLVVLMTATYTARDPQFEYTTMACRGGLMTTESSREQHAVCPGSLMVEGTKQRCACSHHLLSPNIKTPPSTPSPSMNAEVAAEMIEADEMIGEG